MLVLTRKRGEKIIVEGGIEFEVLEVLRGKIRIGITAPRGIRILREELIVDAPVEASEAGRAA